MSKGFELHVGLYWDAIEIMLTQSNWKDVLPNRVLHGYGYDDYFIVLYL